MWPNPQETAVWSYLLKKSLMENFIFCAVKIARQWWLNIVIKESKQLYITLIFYFLVIMFTSCC